MVEVDVSLKAVRLIDNMQQTKGTRTEIRLKLRLSCKAGFHKHKIMDTNTLVFLALMPC